MTPLKLIKSRRNKKSTTSSKKKKNKKHGGHEDTKLLCKLKKLASPSPLPAIPLTSPRTEKWNSETSCSDHPALAPTNTKDNGLEDVFSSPSTRKVLEKLPNVDENTSKKRESQSVENKSRRNTLLRKLSSFADKSSSHAVILNDPVSQKCPEQFLQKTSSQLHCRENYEVKNTNIANISQEKSSRKLLRKLSSFSGSNANSNEREKVGSISPKITLLRKLSRTLSRSLSKDSQSKQEDNFKNLCYHENSVKSGIEGCEEVPNKNDKRKNFNDNDGNNSGDEGSDDDTWRHDINSKRLIPEKRFSVTPWVAKASRVKTYKNNEIVSDSKNSAIRAATEKSEIEIADVLTFLEEEERKEIIARGGRNNFADNGVKNRIRRAGVTHLSKRDVFGKKTDDNCDEYFSSDSEFDFF